MENFIRWRRTNDAIAADAPDIDCEVQTRNIFRRVNKTRAVSLGIFRLKISITEHEEVCFRFEGTAVLWIVRKFQARDRRGIKFFESRLTKTLTPGRAQSQLFVQRLPADTKFGYGHVGIIVTEPLVAASRRDFERMKAGNRILRAENWNVSLRIKGKGFPTAVRDRNRRIACDVAGDV